MKKISELLEIMKDHQVADRLVQGEWLGDHDTGGIFRGCFFGCAMQTDENAIEKACEKYGIPPWVGYWSEKVFEGLSKEYAIKWPVELLQAMVNFNGDYENVRHGLAIKRLSFLSERNTGNIKTVIDGVIDCHKNPDKANWSDADSAADSAAWSAVRSADSAAAWSAAWVREKEWMLEILEGDQV